MFAMWRIPVDVSHLFLVDMHNITIAFSMPHNWDSDNDHDHSVRLVDMDTSQISCWWEGYCVFYIISPEIIVQPGTNKEANVIVKTSTNHQMTTMTDALHNGTTLDASMLAWWIKHCCLSKHTRSVGKVKAMNNGQEHTRPVQCIWNCGTTAFAFISASPSCVSFAQTMSSNLDITEKEHKEWYLDTLSKMAIIVVPSQLLC